MAGFDVDANMIRQLAELIDETGLTEIEYDDGRHRIRVARNAVTSVAMPGQPNPASDAIGPGAAEPPAPDSSHPGAITAPMVGTAYLQPEPNTPAFARVGDRVEEGDTLLIIEAMKVMNQIPSPRGGVVRQVLVANQAPVEYGEVLMIIE